jgi:hypothetical protein
MPPHLTTRRPRLALVATVLGRLRRVKGKGRLLGLAEGPIQLGPEVRSVLYFPRPAPETQGLRLVAVLRDLPATPPLEFRFRRAE